MVTGMVGQYNLNIYPFNHFFHFKIKGLNNVFLYSFLPNAVAQLRGRENQPDRMTMIAIADGNQVRSKVISNLASPKYFYTMFLNYSACQTI